MITHPEKVLFPDDGITKGELAEYYAAVAPSMVPHIKNRPITMERFPAGIGKKGFIQKDVSKGFPGLARTRRGTEEGRHRPPSAGHRFPIAAVDRQSELHHAARVDLADTGSLHARRLRLRSRSAGGRSSPRCCGGAALGLRDLLDELGLPSWVKTSGSKGFHILVSIDGKTRIGDVARFTHQVGTVLVERDPDAPHPGIQQGRSRRPHPGRYRSQRVQRDVCRRLRGPGQEGRARLGAVYAGTKSSAALSVRRRSPPHDGGTDRRGRRAVVRHAPP